MRTSWKVGVCAAGLSLALGACGGGDSNDSASTPNPDGGGGASGAGGAGGASGSGASGSGASGGGAGASGGSDAGTGGTTNSSGPAIDSAPADWDRPAECGGVGNRCPNLSGCEEGSSCQAVGDVCIPALEPGATSLPSKSAERPYCAAFTCMTFEEASCFCTGEAGEVTEDCSSPSAMAGLCVGQGASCAETECCEGFTCIDAGGGRKLCEETCTSAADCETGCCTDPYDTGNMICADLQACENPCRKRGETCEQGDSTTPNNCCRGSCVESDNPDYAGCRPSCFDDSDCTETGCCVPFSGSTRGFCADAKYCSCAAAGDPCGPQESPCCEGTHCTGTTVDDLECNAACTGPADCPSGCCVDVEGADYKVCEGPEFCGGT